MTGGGDGFASDAVDLVESMWSQEAVVCGPDEQLQGKRLAFHVTIKLAGEQRDPGKWQHRAIRAPSQTTLYLSKQRLNARYILMAKGSHGFGTGEGKNNGYYFVIWDFWIPSSVVFALLFSETLLNHPWLSKVFLMSLVSASPWYRSGYDG